MCGVWYIGIERISNENKLIDIYARKTTSVGAWLAYKFLIGGVTDSEILLFSSYSLLKKDKNSPWQFICHNVEKVKFIEILEILQPYHL